MRVLIPETSSRIKEKDKEFISEPMGKSMWETGSKIKEKEKENSH